VNDLQSYHEIGQALIDRLKLTTYPLAVRMIRANEEPPAGVVRPLDAFGSEIPACLAFTYSRRLGLPMYLTRDDIACKPIVIYFGLDVLDDPDDLYRAWAEHAGYKRDLESERKSRAEDARFEPHVYKGLVISALHQTVVQPDLAMIFCSPLVLSHLILAATYNGRNVVSYFNGMESSCKEGIIRPIQTGSCQVVVPGMGDRVMGGVQDHEMIFSIPEDQFETVLENLFKAGNRLNDPSPFSIPHTQPTLGPNKIFERKVEPPVWPNLRQKLKGSKEET